MHDETLKLAVVMFVAQSGLMPKSISSCSVTPHSVYKILLLPTHPIAYHVNPLHLLAQQPLFKTCFSPVSILTALRAG